MTTNVRPGTPPLQPVVYPHVSPRYVSGAMLYDYYLDPETKVDCGAINPETAMADARFYLNELTKWREARGIMIMTYWPVTPGVFQMDDINRLMVRDRRRYGTANPATILLLGRHEREHAAAIGPVSPVPESRAKGVVAKTHELYQPFDLFGVTCYPVNVPSMAELLRG